MPKVLVCAIIFALCVPLAISQGGDAQSKQPKNDTTGKQPKTDIQPSVISNVVVAKDQEGAGGDTHKTEKDPYDKAITWATVAVAVMTGAQLIILFVTTNQSKTNLKLAQKGIQLSEDAAKAAEAAADESKAATEKSLDLTRQALAENRRLADAAADNALTSKQTLAITTRAYLHVEIVSIVYKEGPMLKHGQNINQMGDVIVTYKTTNYGRTPAYITAMWCESFIDGPCWDDYDYVAIPDFPERLPRAAKAHFVLTSKEFREDFTPDRFDGPNVARIIGDEAQELVYSLGCVQYRDVLGTLHEQRFAAYIDLREDGVGTPVVITKDGYNTEHPDPKPPLPPNDD